MYLSAELVAEGFRAILVLLVFLVVVPYDDATALRKGFHHELQRFLVAKDLFALLLELRVDLLLENLLASCRLRLQEREQVLKRFIDDGDGLRVLGHGLSILTSDKSWVSRDRFFHSGLDGNQSRVKRIEETVRNGVYRLRLHAQFL